MKLLIIAIFRFIFKIIYKLSKVFIKEEYVIIAGYKARYLIGNNEYLFNYLAENNINDFEYYFYTKDIKVYNELNSKYPNKIIYPYTLKAFIVILKAKIIVLTSGYDDLSPFPLLSDKVIINLWHGIPMKNIGYKSTKNVNKYFRLFAKSINYYTVSSNFDKEIIKEAFEFTDDNIAITGLQTNDYLNKDHSHVLKENDYLNNHKVILYAPTFRETGMSFLNFSELLPVKELNALLEKHDAYFLYRSHFNTSDEQSLEQFTRIKSASTDIFPTAQPLLFYSDILISDYSGIFFDYLLMDRPIIFYNYDIESYRTHRGLIMNYEENTPGPKVNNQSDLLNAIEEYLINPDKDKEFREEIKKKFHKYEDGKACERTYELIKSLM